MSGRTHPCLYTLPKESPLSDMSTSLYNYYPPKKNSQKASVCLVAFHMQLRGNCEDISKRRDLEKKSLQALS